MIKIFKNVQFIFSDSTVRSNKLQLRKIVWLNKAIWEINWLRPSPSSPHSDSSNCISYFEDKIANNKYFFNLIST